MFDVYPVYDVDIVRAEGSYVWDNKGTKYLDMYGGHAVISIGHTHPHYVEMISSQLSKIGFYSNAVINTLQEELAHKLGELSGYDDYTLFLCNSGAEANENALKLASFTTGRERVLAMHGAFHGRTSLAVAVTDNPAIQAPVNRTDKVTFTPLNDIEAMRAELRSGAYAAVIIEGIQGVSGIRVASDDFLRAVREECDATGTMMILDEVQSGYGRSGRFFSHQWAGVRPDIISMAKGIGNGFPVGAIMISPVIPARTGMLGTTFGGNHLACAAAIAVLDIFESENLVENAADVGGYLMQRLSGIPQIKEVRGKGLMIGMEFGFPVKQLRTELLFGQKVFTGASGTNVIRLLPPLTLTRGLADEFIARLTAALNGIANN